MLAARGGCWFRGHGIELHLGVEQGFRPARKAHPGLLVRNLDSWTGRLRAAHSPVHFDDGYPGMRQADDPAQRAADAAQLEEGLAAIAALRFPGMLAMNVGHDLGLRDGSWNFAITNDWQDAGSYRVYDADEEHNRPRREIFAKICQDIARVQFDVPG